MKVCNEGERQEKCLIQRQRQADGKLHLEFDDIMSKSKHDLEMVLPAPVASARDKLIDREKTSQEEAKEVVGEKESL